MLVFQHFQLPVHFLQDKNGGSKVKVAYCYLVIYELNNMSAFDYHPTNGRLFPSRTLGMEFSIPVPVPKPSKVIPAQP